MSSWALVVTQWDKLIHSLCLNFSSPAHNCHSTRNLTDEEKKGYREVRWDDREVCGCYLVRFCPHDLFVNTKSDLGPCPKIHDPKLKESYEQSSRYELYVPRFEAELAQFCEKLVQDLDRKVRRGRERLAQDVDIASLVPMSTERAEQLATIEEKIKKLLEQSESLGEEGRVDEAQALMKKVDALNVEKMALMQLASSEKGLILSQEKKMALCEICGSFLIANETLERTQSHISGKQHIGYGMVRDYLAAYKVGKEKSKEEEKQAKEKELDEKRKQRETDDLVKRKENGRDRDKERHKEREKEERGSEKEQRERFRDKDRDRERYRYREHERGGRSGERERVTDRDRDRDRDQDRDHDRDRGRDRGRDRDKARDWERERRRTRSRSPLRSSESPPRHMQRRTRSPDSRA